MKVAVTGGSGFIGQHVVAGLLTRFDVVNIDLRPPRADATFKPVNILDLGAIGEALEGVDAVVHLAAIADVDRAMLCPVETMAVNVTGTQAILEAIRTSGRQIPFIHGSTIWVYGDSPDLQTE